MTTWRPAHGVNNKANLSPEAFLLRAAPLAGRDGAAAPTEAVE